VNIDIGGNVGGSLSCCWSNLGFSYGEVKFLHERKDCCSGSVYTLMVAMIANSGDIGKHFRQWKCKREPEGVAMYWDFVIEKGEMEWLAPLLVVAWWGWSTPSKVESLLA